MIKRMVLMLFCVGILFGGIFGYKLFTAEMIKKAMSENRQPPVTVSTIEAEFQTWQPSLRSVGTTRAVRGVDVTTEIAGLVTSLNFQSGHEAQKDQLLVELNAEEDVALLHSLQAQAELAQTTLERDRQQFNINAISKATLDAAIADLKNKKAQVARQQAYVAKKTIRAPFDGRLGITFVNPGQYLNPGDKIVTLQDIHSLLVDFFVPQSELASLMMGQDVEIRTDAYPDRKFEGKITVINPEVDTQSRNIQVEAVIHNPGGELLPGMFVSLDIQSGQSKSFITLPQTAVAYNPYGDTVYVVQSHEQAKGKESQLIVRQTFVTLGETRGDQVAVQEGIKEGDRVVTAGQHKLKNGSPVVINNRIQPSNEKFPEPRDK